MRRMSFRMMWPLSRRLSLMAVLVWTGCFTEGCQSGRTIPAPLVMR